MTTIFRYPLKSEHIERGCQVDNRTCPYALAMLEGVPGSQVYVLSETTELRLNSQDYEISHNDPIPFEIDHFDASRKMRTGTLILNLDALSLTLEPTP